MIERMTKIQLATPVEQEEDLLRWLQEKELLQVTETAKTKGQARTIQDIDYQLAQLQFALEFIERVKSELNIRPRRSLKSLFAPRPAATLDRLERVLRSLDIKTLLSEMHERSDALTNIDTRALKTEEKLAAMEPWRRLQATGEELEGTPGVQHNLARTSRREFPLLKRELQKIKTSVWQEIGQEGTPKNGAIYLEILVHRQEARQLQEVMQSTNAERVQLEVPASKTINQHVGDLRERLKGLRRQREKIVKEAAKYLQREEDIKFAYDALLHHRERAAAQSMIARLDLAVVITGWTPERRLPAFKEELARQFPAACVQKIRPKKGESPPVLLRNQTLIQPFEAVTDIYGRPKHTELDPSPALSIFFLIAFGLALTDAGYGLVMMGGMWTAESFFRLKTGARKMIRLLFYAGASTFVFGVLTGGWFGITLENLPPSGPRDLLLSVKLIDPISSPMTLLLVAFAVGTVQLLFAWVVRGYDHWRRRQYASVLFDDAAWISMIIFILVWAASARGLLPASLEKPFWYLTLANAAVLILTQGRSYRHPLIRIGVGVLSLYGLVSFLSDTLSYSRLLALGLATAIIALVVNMIGGMVAGSIPVLGWVLAATVLLIGHVFNLSINALGAFIHSGRLQFVEFFPKFLEGGGAAYKPLGRVSRYVDNPNEFN